MSLGTRCRALLLSVTTISSACVHATPYQRPVVESPPTFREQAPESATGPSIGEQRWTEVFQDEALQTLITKALAENYDARLAVNRVLQAEASLGITRAAEFPTVDATGAVAGQRFAGVFGLPARTGRAIQVQGAAQWEPDFWGRLRASTASARADLLATEWAQRSVMTSLIAEVSNAYFELRELDLELAIATNTLESRRESLRLTQLREAGGATSMVDVRQAEQLVSSASLEIIRLHRAIAQQENYLSLLAGTNPGTIARGRTLDEQPRGGDVPAGLPSTLLERRPDIAAAEMQLVAAHQQVAIARAAYFPRILLTGSGGLQSSALTTLLNSSAGIWSMAATAAAPVFDGGRRRSQIALAGTREQEAVLRYQQAITGAFRDVADALVQFRAARVFRDEQGRLLAAARDARRLADVRYTGGATSYLEVLDADTRLFAAELGAAQAQLSELTTLVSVYRALGGGWQQ